MTGKGRRRERLARALDDRRGAGADDTAGRLLRAADALTPGVAPRESFRSALKDRMLREAQVAGRQSRADAGTRDGANGEVLHSARVEAGEVGYVVLADVEAISDERAREIADHVARLAASVASEGPFRGQQ